jgi:hypothetical protein
MPIASIASVLRLECTMSRVYLPGAGTVHPGQLCARNRVSLDPAMSLAAICPTLASLGAVGASR